MCRRTILILLLIILTNCVLGKPYQRPKVDIPETWRVEEKEAKDTVNTRWWEQFNDPVLNSLIDEALKQNKDLKIAAARVEEYFALYRVYRAALFPTINAGASVTRERLSEREQIPLSSSIRNPSDLYQIFLNGSWEIDVWGRLRAATEAARAQILSTEEARRTVILTLASAVANAYLNLASLERQREIARNTAKSREETYRILALQFKAGYIAELPLAQARSEYEQSLSVIPPLEKALAQQEDALSVLLGRNPGPIPRGKRLQEFVLPRVPQGLPSDLLVRRPDIKQAEQDLIAAHAQIAIARAQYFPSISLTGLFGLTSVDLASLFSGPARTWNWSAATLAPIFTGGAIAGQVEAAKARQKQALLRYQQVIQSAFREVNDALFDQMKTREQLEVLARQVRSLRDYARLARVRYENGYTSFIEVLDAERSLFNAELQYAQTQEALFQSLVNLYKAMGGGWVYQVDAE